MKYLIFFAILFSSQIDAGPVPINIDLYSSDSFTNASSANDTNITITNHSSLIFEDQSNPSNASISISNDSSLQFNQTSTEVYSGLLSGSGSISKTGSGSLTISSNNAGFTGPLSVLNGTVFLNGAYGGSVSIATGGKVVYLGPISGDLNVPSGTITTNGISTLLVGGNYTQSGSGTYIANFSSSGQSSLISAAGTANIGGFVEIDASQGLLFQHTYKILHANGGVTGTYSLLNPYPLFAVFLTYDANNVYLTSSTSNFSSVAQTPNEIHVANQLDQLNPTTTAEINLLASLASLNASEAQLAFSQMSGEQYTNLILSAFYEDSRFSKRIYNAFRKQLNPCQNFCGYVNPWISGGGGKGFQKGSRATPGFHLSNYDVSSGIHACLNDDWLLGGALGYETDCVRSNLHSKGTLRTGQAALYSAFQREKFYILADLIAANTWTDYHRRIEMGTSVMTAKSHPQVRHGRLDLQLGLNLGSCDFCVQPYLAGTSEVYQQQTIRERGADAANLTIQGQTKWLASNQLGLHFSMNFVETFAIDVDLAWEHYYGNLRVSEETRFTDFGSSFLIQGPERGHDGALGTVYLTKKIGQFWDMYIESEGELWKRWYAFAFNAGVNYKW